MRKALCLALLASFVSWTAQAALLAHWVQLAPGGEAEARVVTEQASCPVALVEGKPTLMRERAAPNDRFPVRVCALTLVAGVRHATVLGQELPVPKAVPERILVFGDTGCRIKGATVQACNDPVAWPFPQIAAVGARLKPDLVIHVGDYLYRESACPAADARCAGSPWGDNWTTWAADFFTPGAPLLDTVPFVIVRGNHEECARSGTGFLRLLGPLPVAEEAACAEHVPPYAVPLGTFDLVVMDNANAVDRGASDELVQSYVQDFASLKRLGSKPLWLAMHHPVWGVVKLAFGMVVGGNTTLESAVDTTGLPESVDLMLAGHIHTFEAINYANKLPPQLIVGEGGDLLDSAPADLSGQTVGTAKIADGLSLPGYGFLLLTREPGRWKIEVFNARGERERTCRYATRHIDCAKSQSGASLISSPNPSR